MASIKSSARTPVPATPGKRGKAFYGWWVVAGLVVIGAAGPMGRYGMTSFFPFISEDLGWSRSLIGSGQSLALWLYAAFVLLSGWMCDHLGGRKTFLIGGFISLVGWLLVSTMRTPWQLYLYYGLIMAVAVSMTHAVPLNATATKWFRRRAGLATGIVSAAFGLGMAVVIPTMVSVAAWIGWRQTSVLSGIIFGLLIMAVAYFVIRDTPESMGLNPDGDETGAVGKPGDRLRRDSVSSKAALKTSAFWLLFASYAISNLPLQGILAHLVVWGVDVGMPQAAAGALVAAMSLPSIATKVGGGWLGDRLGKKRVIILFQVICSALFLWAWAYIKNGSDLTVFSILFGFMYAAPIALFAPYLGELYGRANIGFLFGVLTMGMGLVAGSGPLVFGSIYDRFGSYGWASLLSVLCYVIASVAVALVRTPKTS